MNLSVWNPFQDMEALLDRYGKSDRQTTAAGERNKALEVGDWMPVVDIDETDNEFIVRAELPGVDKENVQVAVDNGILTIRGEKKSEFKDEKRHRVECAYGSFVRSFTMPRYVDVEKVEAAYKEGILRLTIPKEEKAKPKQITVNVQ
ncbi:MAG: Hsp20/alpha crystallin family protein [Candidatus Electrothrix sp. YB6]